MAIWQDIWQLGQKVLALTKTTETNTAIIKKKRKFTLVVNDRAIAINNSHTCR